MDRLLPPWVWWTAAAGCLALVHAVHPWRSAFRASAGVFAGCRRLWLIPAGTAALDAALSCWMNGPRELPEKHTGAMVSTAADMLASCMALPLAPYLSAAAAAVLFLTNTGGSAGGLRRGLETVFPRVGTALWISALVSAGCAVWWAALILYGPVEPLASILLAVSSPWAGLCAAGLLAWLLLYCETKLRAPERLSQVEWPVSVAAYTARLWPWVPAGALAFSVHHSTGPDLFNWRLAAWPAALITAFAPLVLLHVRTSRRFPSGMGLAMERLSGSLGALAMWAGTASAWFFLMQHASRLVQSSASGLWKAPAAAAAAFVLTAVSIRLAAAWIAIQVDKFPPATDGPPRIRPVPKS